MIHYDIVQGTPEWFAIRCGKVTGSRIADLMAKTKSGESASRARYMGELIAERLTGVPMMKSFVSADMLAGKEKEAEARAIYEFRYDVELVQIGFVDHPTIPMSGASPDSFIGENGGLEAKSPIIATHIETLTTKACPGNYYKQIQWNMACSARAWWDYISFCPELPEWGRLFVKRIERDDAMIAEIEKDVRRFQEELDAKLCALRSAYDLTACLKESA
jgi:hypothetical protein